MTRWLMVAWVLLLVVGAGARLYDLSEKSLWSDEVATIATSSGNSIDPEAYVLRGQSFDPPAPVRASEYVQKAMRKSGADNLAQTAQVLRWNVHPPFFFGMMSGWLSLTPPAFERSRHSEGFVTWLRLPAVLFGILGILILSLLPLSFRSENKGGSWTEATGLGVLAGAMMAFSAYQVDHAQDARAYTLLLVWAMASAWLANALIKRRGRQWLFWILLGLTLGLGMLTQYFFIVFFGFVVLVLVWQFAKDASLRNDKMLALGMLICLTIACGMFILWLPYFKEQMVFLAQAGHYTSGLWNPIQLPEKLWRIFAEFFLPKSPVGKVVPLIILLTALASWLSRKPWQAKSGKPWWMPGPVLGFILFWLAAVVGGQVVLDLIKDSHTATIRRYLLLASPAAYLLMAYALVTIGKAPGRWWKRVQVGLITLLLVLMLGDTGRYLFREHQSSDEFKRAAAIINAENQPEDLVLVSKSGAMAVGMAYYLEPQTRMLGVHVPEYKALSDNSSLMNRLQAAVAGHSTVWLVFSHAAPSTQQRLEQWLTAQGYGRQTLQKVRGVKVLKMVRKPKAEPVQVDFR